MIEFEIGQKNSNNKKGINISYITDKNLNLYHKNKRKISANKHIEKKV